jgi:hypothetical protein
MSIGVNNQDWCLTKCVVAITPHERRYLASAAITRTSTTRMSIHMRPMPHIMSPMPSIISVFLVVLDDGPDLPPSGSGTEAFAYPTVCEPS